MIEGEKGELMRPEELKIILGKQPFTPVQFYLTDGMTYDVLHPDQILVDRATIHIGVNPDPGGVPDRVDFVSLLHLVRVEPLTGAPSNRN
jgi:hypothetical protein